ncbi:hypothetical protein HBA54_04820 [Pelagibius litoralis]|uniref:Uncharacterized protein n=1 Tax=Pelagibius litoralis TaxID=374515 RepID=A0A967EWR0_9PROT|nr:hypothetical protein [Pelagibius litoralis]NIA67908.1 hypothetical protein [Pelagibius litoralis]
MMFSKEESRLRFWEATAEKEAIEAKAAGLRGQYDTLRQQIGELQAQLRPIKDQIKAIERPALSDLDMERAFLARGLGKQVGERP